MRRCSLAFALLLLLLAGCASAARTVGSVRFYYRDYYQEEEPDFGSADGILGAETRSYPGELPAYTELLNHYFSTPQSPNLISPFPKGLQCFAASLEEDVLTVRLSEEYAVLQGLNRTIADACLTRTLTQLEGVEGVRLLVGAQEINEDTAVLTARSFVLEDLGAVNTETTVRLYFSDSNGRYLVAEEQKNYFSDAAQIPSYIVQQLIAGPAESDLLAVMPEGTTLRELTVDEDGVCTVNLSSEFLLNKPTTDLMERLTVLAIVNSLTELETIQGVRLLAEGEPIGQYLYLNLDRVLVRDEAAMSVVREALDEIDATLYVRYGDMMLLVPVCVRATAQMTPVEALLQTLIAFEPINGLENPLPEGTELLSAVLADGACHVDLSEEFLDCAGDMAAERFAIRSITSTLSSLPGDVEKVYITVEGKGEGFSFHDLSLSYPAEEDW